MALERDHSSTDMDTLPNKKEEVLEKHTDNGDLERGGSRSRFGHSGDGSVGGRIAPVLPHLTGYDFGNESSEDILGKQIEMEADNAIQYRTCSWQKVCYIHGLSGYIILLQCWWFESLRHFANFGF
jgi:hypothetical protein